MPVGCDTSSFEKALGIEGKVCHSVSVLQAGLRYLSQEREMTWTCCRVNQFIQLIDECLFCCLEVRDRIGCLELLDSCAIRLDIT